MNTKLLRALLVLSAIAGAVIPLQAEARHCSNATAAGSWAYSYTGTIFTQNGSIACRVRRPLSPGRSRQHQRKPDANGGWTSWSRGNHWNHHC